MSQRMNNKVALITGGGSGIGRATCMRFAEEGATVYVSDINLESAETVAGEISAAGGNAIALHQDVTDEAQWHSVIDTITDQQAGLDALVNNAGVVSSLSVEDESLEGWRHVQAVNMEAVYLGTKAAIKVMKNRGGAIVNISSIEGIVGEPLAAAYNASKGGVRIFTKSAALHCAKENYNIRINSVHPGFVGTPMVENGVAALGADQAEEFMNGVLAAVPMQRLGEPLEIANVVLFAASDEASFMTGSELVVDGGFTAK